MTDHRLSRRVVLATIISAILPPGLVRAQATDPNNQEPTEMRVRFRFADHELTATLYGNPSARDFFSLLPLTLEISDYSSNEKIAYLPRKLTEEGAGPFGNEQPYDLCYYMPWGNLAMFYAPYRHPGLIRLGRFDSGTDALHLRGTYSLTIEAL